MDSLKATNIVNLLQWFFDFRLKVEIENKSFK